MDKLDIPAKKRIAIIGAGLSGLGSIVALKEEGLEPVCFEAGDTYGGTWNYKEESVVGYASIMPTTVLNHSKEMGAVSNFPPKKDYSNYMRHREVLEYITEYYEHHECGNYIRFNAEVTSVRMAEDYDRTGRLSVTVRDKNSEAVSTETFDGVMVCTGHFNVPKIGKFPELGNFKGKVIHTHSLKSVDKFSGEKVLIIGTGSSGLNAAEALTSVAKQVYISTRSGRFVFSRAGPNGYPIDHLLLRRYLTALLDYIPVNLCSWYIETFYLDLKFDHEFYFVKPKHHVLSKDPVFNDAIASKLLSGALVQKGPVKNFTENGVVFDGEDDVTQIDTVIMATGYKWEFPFLKNGLLETDNGRINLYKCMYPTQLPHPSLVFIGFVNPIGPGTPVGELQSRYAAQIFAGKAKLPSGAVMLNDAVQRHKKNQIRFVPTEYMSIYVDFVNYLDDIASKIGVRPNLLKYFFTDFPLFLKLVFGPSLPYQYRLEGPHKWEGAREAIMSSNEKLHWPLSRQKRVKKGVLQLIFEFIGNLIPRNIFVY